jgi:hypothetical protein
VCVCVCVCSWLLINLALNREGYVKSTKWQPGNTGAISAFAYRHRETKKKPVSSWPVAGPSEYWLLANSSAPKVTPAVNYFSWVTLFLHFVDCKTWVQTFALPNCHIATLPRCHIATLPLCHIATLPYCHIATSFAIHLTFKALIRVS